MRRHINLTLIDTDFLKFIFNLRIVVKYCVYLPTTTWTSRKYTAVPTGLEKVSFHSNTRERQVHRMLKLLDTCTFCMLVRLCSKSFKLSVSSTWTKNFQIYKWVYKRQRNQRSNCQHSLDHRERKGIPEKCLLRLDWLH